MSENHTIISEIFDRGIWTPDRFFGNWSTAVDTRSLSFCLLNVTGTGHSNNSTLNLALLLYENPTGNITALLQRFHTRYDDTEWIDVTSQRSQLLQDAFRNGPGSDNNNSTTLYESDTDVTFSAPFTCTPSNDGKLMELVFYTPNATNLLTNVIYKANTISVLISRTLTRSGTM